MIAVVIMSVVFLAIAAASWFTALALCRSTGTGPDPAQQPDYRLIARNTILMVILISFVPMPWGFFITLVCWGLGVRALNLPIGRSIAFFVYLTLCSVVERLAMLGVLGL